MQATVDQYGPNLLGYTRATMVGTMGCDSERRSQTSKPYRSTDWGLQLILMMPESLVIRRYHRPVNMSLLLAHTARHLIRAGSG